MKRIFSVIAILCTVNLFAGHVRAADAAGLEFFEARIRPVLVEQCYKCHSAASEKLKGGLRLDSLEGMLKGGESGKAAIVPGDVEKSQLIEAIRYKNEDLQMPPKRKLSDARIAALVAWVNMGAPAPHAAVALTAPEKAKDFWSFKPPISSAMPPVQDGRWPKTPIDNFILSKLEQSGLRPSPATDKRTLIRRASYDLVGLPPTAEEVEAFARDESPEAFAKVVDRLLASPRYGERWARHWLDLARYSDTKGYVYGDREERVFVHAHAYRDWVIRAFNEDLPYDQFLLMQIAADQIPAARPGDLAAMGFLTIGRRFLGIVHDIIDDRIDVVMRTTQGMTVGCARCHDHKFDPIPTKDYYSLYGVFAGSTEKQVALDASPKRTEAYLAYETELQKRIEKLNGTYQKKCDELSDRLRAKATDYLLALLGVEKLHDELFYEFVGPNDLNPVIVRQWQTYIFQTGRQSHPIFAPWHALAALPAGEFTVKTPALLKQFANDSPPRVNPLVLKALATTRPTSMRDVAQTYGKLLADVDKHWREGVKTDAKLQKLADADEESLRQVLYSADSPVRVPAASIADNEFLFDEATRVELGKLQAEVDRLNISSPGAPAYSVILADRPTQVNPRVFKRGSPTSKGEEVPRRFLGILAGENRKPFAHGSGRLELAQAIASKENPLTARVMVNRLWLHHFGAGLVRTPSDFGTRCDGPSHPELLDYLARQFMAEGWSIKKMHRMMMLSAVYQQSSGDQPAAYAADPENHLLWRMNRQRLDFEGLRDSLLAASGEIDLAIGGRPVDLFSKPFTTRRTIYGMIDRQFLPGVFRVFDFASPDLHSPQRHTTTVPQQALFFMNSPFVTERARALVARKDVAKIEDAGQRVQQLYRILYQRPATEGQVRAGLRFMERAGKIPLPPPPKPVPTVWQYGFGELDPASQKIKNFEPLPHFTGEAWQGGADWPDKTLGWVQLTADGGHAGNDLQHAAVRRWVAPADCRVAISGSVAHTHDEGDGIVARIVSSRDGQLASWTLHNQKAEAKVEPVGLKKGDTIDFVVDFRANLNNDDFLWSPVIRILDKPAAADAYAADWDAKKDFGGPPPQTAKPLTAWEQYAQVLMLSNEFVFVD
jgi:hypothetical protein